MTSEFLLVHPRVANPALHDRLMALIERVGYRFRGVRETSGHNPRDLLLAVAEGMGITFGPQSMPQMFGEIGAIVPRRPLDPPQSMPDTVVAWRSDPPPRLGEELAAVSEVARELYE